MKQSKTSQNHALYPQP